MADIYVSNSTANGHPAGSDGDGDGSASAPWATIQKAEQAASGGDTIHINAGTYPETTGATTYWTPNKAFGTFATFQPWDTGDTVIVTGNSDTPAYNILWNANANHYRFRGLTFAVRAGRLDGIPMRIGTGSKAVSDLEFYGCTFDQPNTAATTTITFQADNSNISGLRFYGCHFTNASASTSAYACMIRGDIAGAGTKTTENIVAEYCNFTAASGTAALIGNYIAGVTITGGTVNGTGGFFLGSDSGDYNQTTTGATISNLDINTTGGHALLIGMGAQAAIVHHCRLDGGDNAIVDKGYFTDITDTVVKSGTASALLFKGSQDGFVCNCTFYGAPTIGLVRNDGLGLRNNEAYLVQNCILAADAGSEIFNLLVANDDLPGGINRCLIDGTPGTNTGAIESLLTTGPAAPSIGPAPMRRSSTRPGTTIAWAAQRPLGGLDAYGRPRLHLNALTVGGVEPQTPDRRNRLRPIARFAGEALRA